MGLVFALNSEKKENLTINDSNSNESILDENFSEISETFVQDTINNTSPDSKLNTIVENIKNLAQKKELPVDKLSISLMDLSSYNGGIIPYASYQDNIPRYPASLVKLFWLIIFYEKYELDEIQSEKVKEKLLSQARGYDVIQLNNKEELQAKSSQEVVENVLKRMIKDSDNNATSVVVDFITDTISSKEDLLPNEFNNWKEKRYQLNQFFVEKSYPNNIEEFNISQKTFPIYYIDIESPVGMSTRMETAAMWYFDL